MPQELPDHVEVGARSNESASKSMTNVVPGEILDTCFFEYTGPRSFHVVEAATVAAGKHQRCLFILL